MSRNVIRSIRKGSVQWNEEDRLKVATLLLKAGYSVRIGRIVTDAGSKSSGRTKTEYVIEYWEEKNHADRKDIERGIGRLHKRETSDGIMDKG